jgi:hypothetical protein
LTGAPEELSEAEMAVAAKPRRASLSRLARDAIGKTGVPN